MKKVLLFISILLFTVIPVNAKENKLYIIEKDDKLYYDNSFINDEVFMNHIDMVPGSEFRDELIIENGSNIEYDLYFKVFPKQQSDEANELLENIVMKIIMDDEVLYDGKATGLDYTNEGVNLQDAVLLGNFKAGKKVKMIVETMLSNEYSNTNNDDASYIDWSFYAQYDDISTNDNSNDSNQSNQVVQIVEVPNTMKNNSFIIPVIAIVIVLIGFGIIIYTVKNRKKRLK